MRVKFQAQDEEQPACVIFPGYRMRGVEGTTCNGLAELSNAQGLASLIFDYGGFESPNKDVIDPATMTSTIQDARDVVSFLAGRAQIFMPVSYGINPAMQVLSDDVMAVVTGSPAPDVAQRHIIPILFGGDYEERTAKTGYTQANYPDGTVLKCTRAFLDDTKQHTVFRDDYKFRPPVTLVISKDDPVVPVNLVYSWVDHLRGQGFKVNASYVDDAGHKMPQKFLEAVVKEVVRAQAKSGRWASEATPYSFRFDP